MIQIEKITGELALSLCRTMTKDLPEYLSLPEANKRYIFGVRTRTNFAAKQDDHYIGLVSIDFLFPNNTNIYWMAVKRDFRRRGVGRKLVEVAYQFAKKQGSKTITVETVSPLEAEGDFLKTYLFYKSVGFNALFDLKPEGYKWSMGYMVKLLEPIAANQQW